VRSKSKKVAFPQPRPDGSIPPLHLSKSRHKKTVQPGDGGGGGTGGGTGGGGDPSTADSSFTSNDGYTSYSYDSSDYAEVYDPNGDLSCQMYGDDSSGYSYDIVDPSGTSFSMDMPDFPDDSGDNSYTYTVDGGTITIEISSSSDSGKATYQSSDDGKVTSVTVGSSSTSDSNFDGSGESYYCQLNRLWQATVVAAAIMTGGLAIRSGPSAAGKAGGGVTAGVLAVEQLRVSREYLSSHGC
jgi:hypothetical protein